MEVMMKSFNRIIPGLLVLLVIAGCAKTKFTDHKMLAINQIFRPERIWVYDYATTLDDLPTYSELAEQYSKNSPAQTLRQIETGRKIGAEIAKQLVDQIRSMGMAADHGSNTSAAQLNDIVIHGYILSIDEGGAVKRLGIGFGLGGSELKVLAEGFQFTSQGMRKLGSGSTDSSGSKGPGAALGATALAVTGNPIGLIVSSGLKIYGEATGNATVEGRAKQTVDEIATQLKIRFQQQGWIL
jgi:hypothetical protein